MEFEDDLGNKKSIASNERYYVPVEQMVFSEATVALPLIAGYAYGKGNWRDRSVRRLAQLFDKTQLVSAR